MNKLVLIAVFCMGIFPANTNAQEKTKERQIDPAKVYPLKPRDERSDVWVQDIHRPGLTWYGYYSSNGQFVARFYKLTPMSDLSSLMPHNYRYYHIRQAQVGVVYLGNICGKVPVKGTF